MGRGNVFVRTPDSQSREPGFESSNCRLKTLAISFTTRGHSSLSRTNEYLATNRCEYVIENCLRAVI